MGVMMQAFYWDCPGREGVEHNWWPVVKGEVHGLRDRGFTALWLPPVCKGFSNAGMGYDPYDYYDLGEFDQKGGKATWFGTRSQLEELIAECKEYRVDVYADLVLNHNSGADGQQVNPITGQEDWTKFGPKSGKFMRDWNCFHPSDYESYDDETFGGMPDLCHRNPHVYKEILDYAKWLVEEIGFRGFRYDMVKGYGGWMINAIQEYRYNRRGADYDKPFGVVEHWSDYDTIRTYLEGVNYFNDNPVAAFDFPLRYRLKALCEDPRFDLRELGRGGTVLASDPVLCVTFVDNHDTARSEPIVADKMLAYAYILTHEGYPCVFWEDYYNHDLGQEENRGGIAALVGAHERFAHGSTAILHVDPSLYIMQRTEGGLVFVLNTDATTWRGAVVQTGKPRTRFEPVAFRSEHDAGVPHGERTNDQGEADFWAPPRGYSVYAPA